MLVLGGFLTAPPLYNRLVRLLLDRGAAGAVVAGVWTPDWILAGFRGIGPICSRSGKALRDAVRLSAVVSGGAPVLVIGHSAGGITGRLLTAPDPIEGRKLAAAPWIGAIVTLGTPHRLDGGSGIGRRIHEIGTSIADAHVPGAFFAPEIGYLSVASRAIRSNRSGTGRERIAYLLYRSIIGRAAIPGTAGDGQVPVVATELEGAGRIVLDSAIHGPGAGVSWYGSEGVVDEWWPAAVETWRSALRAREAAAADRVAEGVG